MFRPLIALCVVAGCFGQTTMKINSPDPGVTISPVQSPASDSLDPFSFQLTNKSGKRIVGYTLAWTYTSATGKTHTSYRSIIQEQEFLDGGKKHLKHDGPSTNSIKAGDIVLATPAGVQSASTPVPAAGSAAALGFVRQHSADRSVSFSVDALLYEDGTIVGPDTLGIASAARDILARQKSLIDAFIAAPSVSAAQAVLNEATSGPVPKDANPRKVWNLAKVFQILLARDGLAHSQAAAASLNYQTQPTIGGKK